MDHPCTKCGAAVEDGTPFCPQCNTPQIRVSIGDGNEPATPPLPPGTPDEVQPPARPLFGARREVPGLPALAHLTGGWNRRAAWRVALLVGVIAGIVTIVRSPLLLGLWLLASGGIAVALYRGRTGHQPIPARQGFRVGVLTGFVASLVKAIISSIGVMVPASRAEIIREVNQQVQTAVANNPDPMAQDTLRRIGESITTPSGFAAMFVIGIALFTLYSVLVAGIGGAIGARFGSHTNHH